jgi:hypothetical protein
MARSAQTPRFAEYVRRLFGIRGVMGQNVIDDVLPVLDLLSIRPESYFGRGEFLVSWSVQGTSAAAQFPTHWILNPPGSGRIVVLSEVLVGTSAAAGGSFQWGTAALATIPGVAGSTNSDDDRIRNASAASRTTFESAVGALGAPRRTYAGPASTGQRIPLLQVIPPGIAWAIQVSGVAVELISHVKGYELPAAEEEIRG